MKNSTSIVLSARPAGYPAKVLPSASIMKRLFWSVLSVFLLGAGMLCAANTPANPPAQSPDKSPPKPVTRPATNAIVEADARRAVANVTIQGTDRPNDFRHEISGEAVTITLPDIPAGHLTLELDLAELYHHQSGRRTMAIFCDSALLAAQVDIFSEAGGFGRALTKRFAIEHAQGPLVVRLDSVLDKAQFCGLRILGADGAVLGSVQAKSVGKLQRPRRVNKPFRLLKPEELVFFNADHAPFGAYASLMYGLDERSGGFTHATGVVASGGLLVGFVDSKGATLMPFVKTRATFPADSVKRTLRACSDEWSAPNLSWTHYTPAWKMQDWDKASPDQRRQFLLPATWIEFTLDNRVSKIARTFVFGLPQAFAFGLPQEGQAQEFCDGAYRGFAFKNGTNIDALVAPREDCELVQGEQARALNPLVAGSLLAVKLAPGQHKTLRVIVAHYDTQSFTGALSAGFFYTSLFKSLDEVIVHAAQTFDAAKARCAQVNAQLENSGQNAYRQFLAAHALHSYLYNTCLLRDAQDRPVFCEMEGQYTFVNTFDLTIDHAFYQLAMHPWTLRNVLDRFVDHYSYRDEVIDPRTKQTHPGGLTFTHDMGRGLQFSEEGTSAYEKRTRMNMTVEELLNWVLCAGLYWKSTGDDVWLRQRAGIVRDCLQSLVARDEPDARQRRGIISLVNRPKGMSEEITTYDALDASLKQVRDNLYISVKCWAAYVALEAMLTALHEDQGATTARQQAERAANTIVGYWNARDRFIPAIFNSSNKSRIIPAVEGLIYPQQMGLAKAVAFDGPYGKMIQVLRDHLDSVLKPDVCLDPVSGGWKLSSTHTTTWQSKVYVNQFIAENILKIHDPRTGGQVDAVHASFQVLGGTGCWSDQLGSDTGWQRGSLHYPRGVTSSLWWLKP